MLKSIADVSPDLAQFIEGLNLRLSSPQQQHVKQIADGLITIDGICRTCIDTGLSLSVYSLSLR